MKKIKRIEIHYEDGSMKGYNSKAWKEVLRIKIKDFKEELK